VSDASCLRGEIHGPERGSTGDVGRVDPSGALQGDLPVSDVLLSRAADLDADMIVAGAYHHSQFREALLGGVSRELLEHMTLPVLMSH
jgi:nucleotide-binding universal stress UspA family protein